MLWAESWVRCGGVEVANVELWKVREAEVERRNTGLDCDDLCHFNFTALGSLIVTGVVHKMNKNMPELNSTLQRYSSCSKARTLTVLLVPNWMAS